MISVVLYGRNDSHGYNLHKRASISLNCIAEVLNGEGDEILFVDYNTPNDLPTFTEAIYDTLTPRAKSLLRVFRVRPEVHKRYQKRSHLSALEPVSRNIAIRRSNPANRWILLTNTDMIFVPGEGAKGLLEAVQDLPDGQYILPRFELPEALWETFPRQDPTTVIRMCDDLGTALHLNEVAVSHPYMRFDSPGDFQLVPRQALFDIHGFDERMIHGWHADSNMCKRFWLLYGERSESLAGRLKGYHCDHTRVATLAHRLDIKLENDLDEFVYSVSQPYATHQADTWGLPGEDIEEIDFDHGPQARYIEAVRAALPGRQEREYHSDANDLRSYLFYSPEHVLPFLSGNLTVYPVGARFAYIGNNPELMRLLADCIRRMGFRCDLHYVPSVFSDPSAAAAAVAAPVPPDANLPQYLVSHYDGLVFDFGVAATDAPHCRVTDSPRELRYSIGGVARSLAACVEACDEYARKNGDRPPDFLVVNANHYVFDQFISQFLIATQTPYNTHVRKGRARIGEERLYRSHRWRHTEELMRALFGYDVEDCSIPVVETGSAIDMTASGLSSPYKEGHWGAIDYMGTWTEGRLAELLFRAAPSVNTDLMAHICVAETFLGPGNEPVKVNVRLQGERVGQWVCSSRYASVAYKIVIPKSVLNGGEVCRLGFEIENPHSTALMARLAGERMIGEDPRELGIKVQSVVFTGIERMGYSIGTLVEFTAGGDGVYYTNECWTRPDTLGAWTLGPESNLTLFLTEPPEVPVIAAFTISDVAVNEEHPHLNVAVSFNGEKVSDWTLGPSRVVAERKLMIGPDIINRQMPLKISFRISSPRSPQELKWSAGDTRPLGLRLTSFRMDPVNIPRYRLGDVIEFVEGGNAGDFLNPHWTNGDQYGRWTLGPEASISLRVQEPPAAESIPASFFISDCMVGQSSPSLPVRLKANGKLVEEWSLGPDRTPHHRTVKLPADVIDEKGDLTISFEVPEPRSPASLGWSADSRPLGLRLTRAVIGSDKLPTPDFNQADRETWLASLRRAMPWFGRLASGLRLRFFPAASGSAA